MCSHIQGVIKKKKNIGRDSWPAPTTREESDYVHTERGRADICVSSYSRQRTGMHEMRAIHDGSPRSEATSLIPERQSVQARHQLPLFEM